MKQVYRDYLLRIKEYVNLSACCRACNINQGNLAAFLSGNDNRMSLDNLEKLFKFIKNVA